MKHMKRQQVPKSWPIPRKGTAYVIKQSCGEIPVLVVLRDMLKVARNRKEVKRAIYAGNILINGRAVKDDKSGMALFDVLTNVPAKKSYRLELGHTGKFKVEEINDKDAGHKVAKIIDKKILKGKKIQLNLGDGNNFLSDVKCKTNDSAVIDFATKKIAKCLPLQEKANVIVIAGKHAGDTGIIEKLKPERKMASIKSGENKINVLIKQLMVTQ